MKEIVELRMTVSMMESITLRDEKLGMIFPEIFPTKVSRSVVTDRLLVSDEAVRVLDIRR